MDNRDDYKLGLVLSISAYVIWGLFTLYWKLLEGAGSWEIIAHRILWTPLFVFPYLWYRHEIGEFIDFLHKVFCWKILPWLALASGVACMNYWVNVYATQIDHVIELGIGMFMTPLFSIFFGLLFFKERLAKLEVASVLVAIGGLGILMVDYGRIPWIALGVSLTWALYGAIKKRLRLSGTYSITVEILMVVPFALAYLVYLEIHGIGAFSLSSTPGLSIALIGVGFVTVVPLIFFSIGAVMLPLSVMGFVQYINPVMTVAVGAFVFGEPVTMTELKTLAAIAIAVVLFVRSQYVTKTNQD